MPVSPHHSKEQTDKMFVENVPLGHRRRHHEFFLHARPYRGEPPTVAGKGLSQPSRMFVMLSIFLLYFLKYIVFQIGKVFSWFFQINMVLIVFEY